jgi:hypothetical protein
VNDALRGLLVRWQFWVLEIQFVIVVITAVMALRSVRVRPGPGLAALAICVTAWILTATLPPRTNRIFYDEHIYQGVAQNMSDAHLTQMCNEGEVEYGRLHCLRGEYNKEPAGYPYLLSLLYRMGGVNDEWAPRFNNAVAAATTLVTIGLAATLFQSTFAAVVAGIVMMLLPMQLTWSNTAAAEPVAALATGSAVLLAVAFARWRSTSLLMAAAAMTVFATTFRPESGLVVPLVGMAIVLLAPDELRRGRLWIVAAGALLLMVPSVVHLLVVRNEAWGAPEGRLSWRFASNNLPVNLRFYFADARFPALIGLSAIVGLAGRRQVKERLLLLLYFAAFWSMFLFFYAGSYNYGADVRYSLLTGIPIAVLAGVGLETFAVGLARRIQPAMSRAAVCRITVFCLLLQFLWYTPLVRETGEEAWAARADVEYAKAWAKTLPRNSIVLTHNPSMFHLWGVNAAQLSIAANEPAYVQTHLLQRYAGGVYVHWNFWCNVVDPVQVRVCEQALTHLPHDLVATRRQRDQRFALYRLRQP